MTSNQDRQLNILLSEYAKLKEEQKSRIGFRDNLIYVTLTVYGGLSAFALSDSKFYPTFLVLPWICIILGWTYVVNDEKISAIGGYIRLKLTAEVKKLYEGNDSGIVFGWEIEHRSDEQRKDRKAMQLLIDLVTFVVPGAAALIAFHLLINPPHPLLVVIEIIELTFLIGLTVQIFRYADLASGR